MIEELVKQALLAGVALAKEAFGDRIKKHNAERLSEKRLRFRSRESAKRTVTEEEVQRIALSDNEAIEGEIRFSIEEMVQHLRAHDAEIRDWAAEVGFKDLHVSKKLSDVYIELDSWLTPLGSQMNTSNVEDTIPLISSLLGSSEHSIVLGQPGSGKTTSMKKICSHLHKYQKDVERPTIPLVLRLREIPTSRELPSITAALGKTLGLAANLKNAEYETLVEIQQVLICTALDALGTVIILDGFDELPSYEAKERTAAELRELFAKVKIAKIVVTCRSGEFNYHLQRSRVFEIAPLADAQITSFSLAWLADEDQASRFVSAVSSSPYFDSMRRPLALAHLCAIFERTGRIPDRPKTIYRKIVGLLLEEWDEQRLIRRQSRFGEFEADRKLEFLANFSFHLTSNTGQTVFDQSLFRSAFREIAPNFKLSANSAQSVFAELESHTGLLLKCGYDKYEFCHKSVQEFLAAEYLVKLPRVPQEDAAIARLPNELAIAVSISSNPSAYFCELVLSRFGSSRFPPEFFDTFVSRIVVERPDFIPFEDMIIALNVLQTLWICEGKVTGRTVSPRRIDSNSLRRFAEFRSLTDTSRSFGKVASYYDALPDQRLEVGNVILTKAKRRRSHPIYSLPTYVLVPASASAGDA